MEASAAILDPDETALLLWAEFLGLTILLDRKSAYLREYRHFDPQKLVDAMFRHIKQSIVAAKSEGK